MKIVFISKYYYPHIGGVERHVQALNYELRRKNYDISVITEEFDEKLKGTEKIKGIDVYRISYPHIKFFGLIRIWIEIFKKRSLIDQSDIVHIHDVFIWYLPFKLLFPRKKVFITFHGWEGKYPIPFWNKLNKKVANLMTSGSIAVGKYIEKYYEIKCDEVIYGGVSKMQNAKKTNAKLKNTIVFLGRLEKDTGVLWFLDYFRTLKDGSEVVFVGDGSLRQKCEKYGKVTGFIKNPEKYLKTAKTCVPSGYLSYLEAKNLGCQIKTFANNPLKKDYWNDVINLKGVPRWNKVVENYLQLWQV